ncbi:DUF732 domain-containing protein [Streptomyces antibioticus]|uniref:DUF732 domain-containing protein n=1 Tax=Streptomyces antibioticus TaxID=1890 RepID=UPI003710D259
MRTRTIIATTAILAGGLAACLSGSSDDTSSTDSKPKVTTAPAKNHSTAETAYLTTTRAKVPALEKVADDDLINFGRTSCTAIDAGNSPAAVAVKAEEGLQIGQANSAYLVGAAVSSFCPEHKNKL